MKKLLIAMSAAAMFSLCAKADDPTLLGSMDFQRYTEGAQIELEQESDANNLILWAGSNGESQIAVDGENKYLKVDTTETLVRQTAELNATTNAPVNIGTGDITVSSKVQFTAADEAPEITTGDKLIVWAKAPDEDDPNSTTTNLMVTAKTAGGVVTNFVTDVLVDAETWYNLEIKAVATGSQGEGNASAAFTVSIAPAGSTPVAVTVDGQAATFKSLLNDNVTGAQTIASIGFKGTGAVDDIVFAKNEAVVVDNFTFNATITDVYDEGSGEFPGLNSATYQIDSATPVSFETPLNLSIPVTAAKVKFALTVYDDSEVTNEGAVKGESVSLADGNAYIWTLEVDVSGSTAQTVKNVAITIAKTGSQPPQPEEPSITPSAGQTEIEISGEGITDKDAAEGAAIAAIKAPTGVDADTYRTYFKATAADPVNGVYTVTVELDPDEVTPEIDADNEGLDIAGGKIAVETKPGLFYQLLRGTVPTTIATTVAEVQADAAAEVLTDANPPAGKAFYKVSVTAAATQNQNND